MISGKTRTGFEYNIEDDVLNDYELLEALNGVVEAESPLSIIKVVNMLLGKDKARLKAHIRNVTGRERITIDDMQAELEDIMMSSEEGKNS